jgi:hypothetical protein
LDPAPDIVRPEDPVSGIKLVPSPPRPRAPLDKVNALEIARAKCSEARENYLGSLGKADKGADVRKAALDSLTKAEQLLGEASQCLEWADSSSSEVDVLKKQVSDMSTFCKQQRERLLPFLPSSSAK